MTQEMKDEALEQLELDIRFGFDDEETMFERIREMFYSEEDFDEEWLALAISDRYKQHQEESLTWSHPTDFEKVCKAFDELIAQKVVCLHKAGYTRQDAEGDCMDVIERLGKIGVKAMGYCYYHEQDLGRVIDATGSGLLMGFDSANGDDGEALLVANKVVEAMTRQGFEIKWNGAIEQRIEVLNVCWQKVPDAQSWDGERVMRALANAGEKKPFWKLW